MRRTKHATQTPTRISTRLSTRRLTRADFALPADQLARALLGRVLARRLDDGTLLRARIVEVEAYMGVRDKASHAWNGRRTQRNGAMYMAAGTAYVYFTYGMHFCMNVVCGEVDEPVAVLLRALEPVEGQARMARERAGKAKRPLRERDLCSGPAKLCKAFAIARAQNMLDLTRDQTLWIEEGAPVPSKHVGRAPRVGISGAEEWTARLLRWGIKGNEHVSVKLQRR